MELILTVLMVAFIIVFILVLGCGLSVFWYMIVKTLQQWEEDKKNGRR